MKKTLLLFVSAVTCSLIFLSSCKKSIASPTTQSIVGLWLGTYTVDDNSQDTLYYSFDIKSDSSIIIQGQGDDGITYYQYGSWSLSGNSFSALTVTKDGYNGSNSGVQETQTAVYDSSTGKLTSGVWQTIYHTGKFMLEKIN